MSTIYIFGYEDAGKTSLMVQTWEFLAYLKMINKEKRLSFSLNISYGINVTVSYDIQHIDISDSYTIRILASGGSIRQKDTCEHRYELLERACSPENKRKPLVIVIDPLVLYPSRFMEEYKIDQSKFREIRDNARTLLEEVIVSLKTRNAYRRKIHILINKGDIISDRDPSEVVSKAKEYLADLIRRHLYGVSEDQIKYYVTSAIIGALEHELLYRKFRRAPSIESPPEHMRAKNMVMQLIKQNPEVRNELIEKLNNPRIREYIINGIRSILNLAPRIERLRITDKTYVEFLDWLLQQIE